MKSHYQADVGVERECLFGGCDSTLRTAVPGLVYELNRLLYGAAGKETHRVMFFKHVQALTARLSEDLPVRTAA